MGSKNSRAPDYQGAAQQQGDDQKEIAELTLAANRPNAYTPFGSQQWFGQPGDDNYGYTINLRPEQQAALDAQTRIQAGRSGIAEGLLNTSGAEMQTPEGFWEGLTQQGGAPNVPTYGEGLIDYATPTNTGVDLSQLPGPGRGPTPGGLQAGPDYSGLNDLGQTEYDPRFADAFYERNMSLLGPQMKRDQAALNTQLRNQGLTGSSEAFRQGTNDLRNQQGEQLGRLSQDAVLQGAMEQQREFGRGLQARQQGVGEEQFGANFGLAADQQRYGQELGAGTFQEQQRGARLGEQQGQVDEAFRQAQFQNQLRGQQNVEQLATGAQQFGQEMQQSQMQTQLRQQEITEQLQREGWSLNKINAMLSGQQVGLPSFPDFKSQGQYDAPDYLGAAQAQGDYQSANNPWQVAGQLGAGLLGNAGLFV